MSAFYARYPASAPPVGGATSANQVLEIAQLTAINSNTTGASTAANQATVITKLTTIDTDLNTFSAKTASALVGVAFDYMTLTYVGATTNISTVVYKLGGSGGTTVATLTLGYDGSNRLTSVTRS